MDRRNFIKSTSLATAAISLGSLDPLAWQQQAHNKLPKWRGFNLLDFFSPNFNTTKPGTTEDHFKWMQDWGFDFVRVPIAYPYYLNIDRTKDITPDDVYK